MNKSVCGYISVTATQHTHDSWLWDFLSFAAWLCVLWKLTRTCVLPQKGLPVVCPVMFSLLLTGFIPRKFISQAAATLGTEIFYRTWEFLKNVRTCHIYSVCVLDIVRPWAVRTNGSTLPTLQVPVSHNAHWATPTDRPQAYLQYVYNSYITTLLLHVNWYKWERQQQTFRAWSWRCEDGYRLLQTDPGPGGGAAQHVCRR